MARRGRRASSHNPQNSVDPELVYTILGSATKRKIILFLGERGKASFTELKRELKISVGNLYYNLDSLSQLITKDENRKYMLTPHGQYVYRIIMEESRRISSYLKPKGKFHSFACKYIIPVFVPQWVMIALYKSRRALSAITAISLALMAVLSLATGHGLLLIELSEEPFPRQAYLCGISVPGCALAGLTALLSWLVLSSSLELITRSMGHSENSLDFVLSTSIALLPLVCFLAVKLSLGNVGGGLIGEIALGVVYRVLQALVIGLLTSSLATFKHMSVERSFVVASLVFYASFILSVVLRRLI